MAPNKRIHVDSAHKKRKVLESSRRHLDKEIEVPTPAETFDRRRFQSKIKEKRYEEIKMWSIVPERRVELEPGEREEFRGAIIKKNWERLAKPDKTFNPDIVKEFYANAWRNDEKENKKTSWVRGRHIPYDWDAINKFLGNPGKLAEDGMDTYQRMLKRKEFKLEEVAEKLCLPGCSFDMNSKGEPAHLKRDSMTELTFVHESHFV